MSERLKVLVAEDDNVARRVLVRYLDRWGYDVLSATDGLAAWDLLERHDDIAIAILDWMMPGMDGIDLCRRLREGEGETKRTIHILLCTARTEVADIVAGLDAGADDYLPKPVRGAELEARLRVGARNVLLERELQRRIRELSAALEHVKQLQGLLPICMHCHRIRNSEDTWQQIETYMAEHADVEFSHGLCDQCLHEHYPDTAKT